MFFSCSSRQILTAISSVGAAPMMTAKPGIVPSTSWMPRLRWIVSEMKPL